jgi:hypothetical protein
LKEQKAVTPLQDLPLTIKISSEGNPASVTYGGIFAQQLWGMRTLGLQLMVSQNFGGPEETFRGIFKQERKSKSTH